jgi:serine/threonine protein kinase
MNFSDYFVVFAFQGELSGGIEVAIKRLSTGSVQGLMEFKTEIQLIAKLQHTNLVRLLGCCLQAEEKMLIYEYMHNKSLDCFIFGTRDAFHSIHRSSLLLHFLSNILTDCCCSADSTRGAILNWERRFTIIDGIAQGLLYMHKHSRLRVVHRDLKASNILLDRDMNPKISDFGLARIFCSNTTEANTTRVMGTQ